MCVLETIVPGSGGIVALPSLERERVWVGPACVVAIIYYDHNMNKNNTILKDQ